MPGGGIEQGRIAAHVRVVTQTGPRALGFGDPGLAGAVDHAQAHQLAAFLGQAVEYRLDDVGAAAGQIAKAQRHQLGGQLIAAVVTVLAYVAQAREFSEHAMGCALGDLKLVSQGLQAQALGLGGKAFYKTEGAFDLTTGHDRVS
ncbi:hypothetical protein D3C81_1689720 [compost metagenome]